MHVFNYYYIREEMTDSLTLIMLLTQKLNVLIICYVQNILNNAFISSSLCIKIQDIYKTMFNAFVFLIKIFPICLYRKRGTFNLLFYSLLVNVSTHDRFKCILKMNVNTSVY